MYYELVGEGFTIDDSGEYKFFEDVVATFDTKDQAEQYEQWACLKRPKRSSNGSALRYRQGTLLRKYVRTKIYEIRGVALPHNPAFVPIRTNAMKSPLRRNDKLIERTY